MNMSSRVAESKGTTVSHLLQQLPSREAVLLMYVADELPPADRAEVERMLSADVAMGAELERLAEAHAAFAGAMPALDRLTPLPVPEAVGVRRVTNAMRQWQARRAARPTAAPALPALRFPWWTYPLAAAASVVFAFAAWWGYSDRPVAPDRYTVRHGGIHDAAFYGSPDMDVAMAWEMGAPVEEVEEVRALVESSDYNIFFLTLDDPDSGGAAPRREQPSDSGSEEDDAYL